MEELKTKKIEELRVLVRQKGLLKGSSVNLLSKEQLIDILTGEKEPVEVRLEFDNNNNGNNNGNGRATKQVTEQVTEQATEQQVIKAIKTLMGAVQPSLNAEQVRELISQQVSDFLSKWDLEKSVQESLEKYLETRNLIKIQKPNAVKLERVHRQFNTIYELASIRTNIWLYGEAGSGKTTLASKVAEALQLPFYSISVNGQTTKSDLFGYKDAQGNYQESLFYTAYTQGGVFCVDEIDAGNPNVLTALNQATANGSAAFPNGMQKKHENFVLIACGNTIGEGANRQYIGRNPIDLATRSRFVYIEVNTDWDLLKELVSPQWFEFSMKIREYLQTSNTNNIIFTSRSLLDGEKLRQLGWNNAKILDAVLFKGCEPSTRQKVLRGLGL